MCICFSCSFIKDLKKNNFFWQWWYSHDFAQFLFDKILIITNDTSLLFHHFIYFHSSFSYSPSWKEGKVCLQCPLQQSKKSVCLWQIEKKSCNLCLCVLLKWRQKCEKRKTVQDCVLYSFTMFCVTQMWGEWLCMKWLFTR